MRIAKPGRSTSSKVLVKILHFVSGFYIEVIRGTPMLVQLFIIYYIAYGPGGLSAPDFTLFGFIKWVSSTASSSSLASSPFP